MSDIDILKEVLEAICNETQPIEGHPDPGAIADCWREAWERISEIERYIQNSVKIVGHTREGFPVYDNRL